MDTHTKEHSAEYQAQAWIGLAGKLHHEHPEASDPAKVPSRLFILDLSDKMDLG